MAPWWKWWPCTKDFYLMAEFISLKHFSCRAWLTFRYHIVCLTFPSPSSSSYRGSHWGGGTSPRGCTPMTTPIVMRPAPAQSARTAQGTVASPITCARRRTWRRSWTTAPAPTGRRGRRACWACRISSRAKEYWGGIGLMWLGRVHFGTMSNSFKCDQRL